MGYCNRKGVECKLAQNKFGVCNTDNCNRNLPDVFVNAKLARSEFAIGREYKPNTISLGIKNNSAVLIVGNHTYDLRCIDFGKYEAIEIDGIRFIKEVE